jgi:hypothetical protein
MDPQTKTRARGVLVLDDKQAVTTVGFGRETGTKRLSLIFNVTGCEIDPETQEPPDFEVLPKPDDAEQLETAVLKPEKPRTDGTSFRQVFRVNTDDFDPGSYSGVLLLNAGYLAANRTPLGVSRSEDNELIPSGLGALGGFIGLIWFGALKLVARNKLAISWWWLILVVPLAVGAGAWAVLNAYWDQDVWTFSANGPAAVGAGFAGASTGAALGLLTAIFKSPPAAGG